MGVVLTESWDAITTTSQRGWTGTNATLTAAAARTGPHGLPMSGGQGAIKTLPAAITYIAGVAYRTTAYNFTGFGQVIAFLDGATVQVDLRLQGSAGGQGTFEVTRNGTVLGSVSTYALPVNIFHYIELEVTVDPVTGSVIARVDGNVIISVSGANTRATANTQINGIELFGQNGPVHFDDVVVLDKSGAAPNNDFLGDVAVYALLASGGGTYTQYTSSSGNPNYQNIDEASPNDDTDYNFDSVSGHKDSFVFQSLVLPASAPVYAVNLIIRAEKDDSGPRSLNGLARFPKGGGGTDYLNATVFNLGFPYQSFDSFVVYQLAPDGSTWSVASVNNIEWGYGTV